MSAPGCSVPGCPRPHRARGYCVTHYDIAKRRGDFGPPPTCAVEGCGRPRESKSLCLAHYRRLKVGKPLETPLRDYPRGYSTMPAAGQTCRLTGCGRPVRARGLCDTHWKRRRTTPGEWSHPVTSKRGARQQGELVHVGALFLPPEWLALLQEEASARRVRRQYVLREWLGEVVSRKQEEARQEALRRLDFGRQKTGPKPRAHNDEGPGMQDAARARNARIRDVLRRETLTAEQLSERFGVSIDNAHQLLVRARKVAGA
jgi:hypothetical protein